MLPLLVLTVWLPPALFFTVKIIRERDGELTETPQRKRPVVYARVPFKHIHVEKGEIVTPTRDAAPPSDEQASTHVGLILDPILRPTSCGVLVAIQGFGHEAGRNLKIEHVEKPGYWTLCMN